MSYSPKPAFNVRQSSRRPAAQSRQVRYFISLLFTIIFIDYFISVVVNKAKTGMSLAYNTSHLSVLTFFVVAKKVVNYVKTKGPEIGKVALKAASTAVEGASKFVQFIPVVGKPLSKVMDVGGKLLNKASNSIHTKVDGGVGNALNGMNKAQQVLKFIPRELAGSYHQRDVAALSARDLYELNAILARDTYSNSKNGLY